MTDFYLVTGFLGAGKTTFLSSFLPRFKGKNLRLIINEFGNSGVDGDLLKSIDAKLDEICGGSIFCSCKLDRFEVAMNDCLSTNPDVIVVEASGLSDPTNIKKILNSYEEKGILSYKGCVCLVDAVRFHKVFSTARVVKKQLAVADIVLINKTDLRNEDEIKELEETICGSFPYCKIVHSEFGKSDYNFDNLKVTGEVEFDVMSYRPDVTTQKATITVDENMSKYELEKFINLFAEDTARIKGYVVLKDSGTVLVDCVGPMVSVKPWINNNEIENTINVMATAGQNTRKAVKKAVSLYNDKVKVVFG